MTLTIKYTSDLANKSVRAKNFKPRIRPAGETPGQDPHFDWRKRPAYKPGDGDHNVYIPREGSCHKHLKSHGDRT